MPTEDTAAVAPSRRPAWSAVVPWAVLVTVATWPIRPELIDGSRRFDPSWEAGLAAAHDLGLRFGPQIVYNYGPLGWLDGPLFTTSGLWGWAVQIAARVILAAVAIGSLRRIVPAPVAAAVTFGLFLFFDPRLTLVTTLVSVMWFTDVLCTRRAVAPRTAAWAGLATGVMVLTKFDQAILTGAVTLGVSVLAASVPLRPAAAVRNTLAHLLALAVTVPLGFVVTGNRLGDLGLWLTRSADLVVGFPRTMSLARSMPIAAWEVLAAVAVVILLAGLAFAVVRKDGRRGEALRWGAFALALGYLTARTGFGRHDADHARQFFAVLVFAVVGAAATLGRRRLLALAAVLLVATLPGQATSITAPSELAHLPRHLLDTARLTVSSRARADFFERQATEWKDTYRIPRSMLDRIGRSGVHVLPWEAAAVFAYGMRWHPLPVFQDPQVDHPELDRVNIEALTGPDRPEFVLEQPEARLDEKLQRFQPPGGHLALLCHYRLVDASANWRLLRAASDRCGRERTVATVTARQGDVVRAPRVGRNSVLVARFEGIDDAPAARAFEALIRGRMIRIDDGGSDEPYRFESFLQSQPHVMAWPRCLDRQMDRTRPQFRSFRIRVVTPPRGNGDDYRIRFSEVPLRDCTG